METFTKRRREGESCCILCVLFDSDLCECTFSASLGFPVILLATHLHKSCGDWYSMHVMTQRPAASRKAKSSIFLDWVREMKRIHSGCFSQAGTEGLQSQSVVQEWKSRVKYLNNYFLNSHDIWCRHLWSKEKKIPMTSVISWLFIVPPAGQNFHLSNTSVLEKLPLIMFNANALTWL